MTRPTATSYDLVPYAREAYAYTHPDVLATIATLFGLEPPSLAGCRVLELGCAAGDNLIPMAISLPRAHFTGIDLSSRQVASGQQAVAALGLANVDLKAMSILEVGDDLGLFDYIICHGVYSWVGREIQDKILSICASNLAPSGVAYVSYNTYPGWCATGMARDMMRFHVEPLADHEARVQQARVFLGFLAGSARDLQSAYAHALREESARANTRSDVVLFHDQLEGENDPVYFHQFVERAAGQGLQYLQDALYGSAFLARRPETQALLDSLSADFLRQEQYFDFLTNGRFRRSLLCHREATVVRSPRAAAVSRLQVTGLARPQAAPAAGSAPTQMEEFRTAAGASITSNNPVVTSSLLALGEVAPRSLAFDALCQAVTSRVQQMPGLEQVDPHRLAAFLAEFLLQAWRADLVELHVHVPPLDVEPGERPLASPWARYEARAGGARVTNLFHRRVELAPLERLVLAQLDGQNDRSTLQRQLAEAAAQEDPQRPLDELLAQILHRLADAALLLPGQA